MATSTSSSYALNATNAVSSTTATSATSASYALNSNNAVNASTATSASYAATASYLLGYVSPFPFTGSAIISGSLIVTGSTSVNGALTVTNGITGSMYGTSSFALTASYSLSGTGFPFSGSAVITGSLLVSNLSGSGVRYVVTDANGNMSAQSASAALKSTQAFTSTAGQTTFAVSGGFVSGYVDVFVNGTKLSTAEFTDTSGANVVLATGSFSGDVVEVVKYMPAAGVSTNVLRQLTTYTATAGQTVFTASYTPGLLDIYYNGARLSGADYTAANGTSITLATASAVGDILDVMVYTYQAGAYSGIGGQGTANQLSYYSTSNSITGSNNLTYNGTSLFVSGSVTATNGLYSVNTFTGSYQDGIVVDYTTGNGRISVGTADNISFYNGGPASASLMTISASGNVFISGSITTPGTITAQTLVIQTITSSVEFITGSSINGSLLTNTHVFSGSVYMNPNGLFVSGSGLVGIGTTTPSYNLDVTGTGRFTGNLTLQGSYADFQNTTYVKFSNTGGGTRWGYIQHDGTNMAFANDVSGGIFSFNKAATFSSTINSGVVTITNSPITGVGLYLDGTAYSGHKWALGDGITTNTTFSIKDITSGVEAFKIASTGAATFSNLVTTNTTDLNVGFKMKSTSGVFSFTPYYNSTYGGFFNALNAAESAYIPLTFTASSFNFLTGNVLIGTTTDFGQKIQASGLANIYSSYTSFQTSTKTTTSGANLTFVMGTDYGQGAITDNVGGLVIINISEANTNISLGNAIYVGVVINPRGSGGAINQISKVLGGGVSALSLSMSGNSIVVNATMTDSGNYRASMTFIGGAGTS